MSKKDYIKFASVIKMARKLHTEPVARFAIFDIETGLASAFEKDNPNFDKEKFYDACKFPLDNS